MTAEDGFRIAVPSAWANRLPSAAVEGYLVVDNDDTSTETISRAINSLYRAAKTEPM